MEDRAKIAPDWCVLPGAKPCASTIAFGFKNGTWIQLTAPDVARYNLEQVRSARSCFAPPLVPIKMEVSNGTFSEFADARTLKSFNSTFISRDRQDAETGDLLFFYQPWVQKYPYHVMVFLGRAKMGANPANDWVVYHTGASATDEGTVKKVELSVLDQHPNKRWRPIESNSNFLGFYRLKILD